MRSHLALLLYAALFARTSHAAAVRYEVPQRRFVNGTVTSQTFTDSTTASLDTTASSDTSGGVSSPDYSLPGEPSTTTGATTFTDSATYPAPSSNTTTSINDASSTGSRNTSLSSSMSFTSTRSTSSHLTATIITSCDPSDPDCSNTGGTHTVNPQPPPPPTIAPFPSSSTCTPLREDAPMTVFSVVYTETVTFFGNRTGYTPPYAPLSTPNYCETTNPAYSSVPVTRSSRKGALPPASDATSYVVTTSAGQVITLSGMLPLPSEVPPEAPPPAPVFPPRPTVTFVTTARNPSVVYPSDSPPNYDPTGLDGAPGDGAQKTRAGGGSTPRPTYVVTAGGNEVVINDSTFKGLQPSKTSVVTVGNGVFTIEPTLVVGEGATVVKPQPVDTESAPPAPTPTTELLDGVSVQASGSVAVVDGTTLTIPADGTATIIQGKSVSAGPGILIVGDETMTYQVAVALKTDIAVAGGEMLTAIGPTIAVLHSTTITYGPGIARTTEVVDDDTITFGPSGVTVHGSTLGGPDAKPTETTFEIVGGATITEIGSSLVVVGGTTYTVGPSAELFTTVIGGETLTIGPNGVTVSTITFSFPFGSVVTTIKPSGTWTDDTPTETGEIVNVNGNNDSKDGEDGDDDDDSLASSLRPGVAAVLCIALGVWIF